MFETKLQRGRFLVVVFVVLVAGLRVLGWWGTNAANDEAARRTREIQVALKGHTPADLQPELLRASVDARAPGLPGGPYSFVGPVDGGGLRAGVTIHKGLQTRCIRVDLAADGTLAVRTEKRC